MTTKAQEITERLTKTLVGQKITGVEYVGTGVHGEDSDYLVLQIEGDRTLYANAPTLYVPVEGADDREVIEA